MKIILLLLSFWAFISCTNNPDSPTKTKEREQPKDSLEPAGGEGISDSSYLRDTLSRQ